MAERLLILGLVAVGVAGIWGLVRLWRAWSVRRMQVVSPFAGLVPVGRPAVVAFSTPSCAECKTRQAPALTRLAGELGEDVAIVRLSALEHPELVEQAGILTVPATVVLDASGAVRHLNLGFTDAARLATQVRGASNFVQAVV